MRGRLSFFGGMFCGAAFAYEFDARTDCDSLRRGTCGRVQQPSARAGTAMRFSGGDASCEISE